VLLEIRKQRKMIMGHRLNLMSIQYQITLDNQLSGIIKCLEQQNIQSKVLNLGISIYKVCKPKIAV